MMPPARRQPAQDCSRTLWEAEAPADTRATGNACFGRSLNLPNKSQRFESNSTSQIETV